MNKGYKINQLQLTWQMPKLLSMQRKRNGSIKQPEL